MARVVVDVMLKPEILDPQGQAILGALGRLGHSAVTSVRQGKHFEIELRDTGPDADATTDGDGVGVSADTLAEIRELAGTVLSNPVIEDFSIRVS